MPKSSAPAPTTMTPLADRMRPNALELCVGQRHLLGPGAPLRVMVSKGHIPSMILWGPPGCGKTTFAHLLSKERPFYTLSAVLSGTPVFRKMVAEIQAKKESAVLFLDEIHRWNKAQQDALLPYVEKGVVTLIGATTENPSFALIAPLLSRCRVFVLRALDRKDIRLLLDRALSDTERGLGAWKGKVDPEVLDVLSDGASGDVRQAYNLLEMVIHISHHVTLDELRSALAQKTLRYDKEGEAHYDTISAFIKSMRGSDPDAAIYYLARMLEAGEDARFIARRMIIFAAEDIGNADPRALQIAVAAAESYERVGEAEGWIPLSQAVTYLACAPKSNASYMAYREAKSDVETHGDLEIPMHIRNAPTELMRALGYGKGYQYAHDQIETAVTHNHLPDMLVERRYYKPSDRGFEKHIQERLMWLAQKRKERV